AAQANAAHSEQPATATECLGPIRFLPAGNLREEIAALWSGFENLRNRIAKMNHSLSSGLLARVGDCARAPINVFSAKHRHIALGCAQIPEQFIIDAQFSVALATDNF